VERLRAARATKQQLTTAAGEVRPRKRPYQGNNQAGCATRATNNARRRMPREALNVGDQGKRAHRPSSRRRSRMAQRRCNRALAAPAGERAA